MSKIRLIPPKIKKVIPEKKTQEVIHVKVEWSKPSVDMFAVKCTKCSEWFVPSWLKPKTIYASLMRCTFRCPNCKEEMKTCGNNLDVSEF